MIYLFNSGFRPNYTQNVNRTLFLPTGWTNEYRYRFNGERPNIDPTKVDDFLNLNRFYKFKKEEVLICFIDRFAEGGYSYHPLRRGKLVKCFINGDKLFFRVKLLEFISPNNNNEFNAQIKTIGNLPHLTDNDPEYSNDGFYAIKNNDITKKTISYISGENAWNKITDDIKVTRAFIANDIKETVFARLSINSNSRFRDNKFPIIRKDNCFFKITKSHKYSLNLFYKYPNQVQNNTVNLRLSTKDSLKVLTEDCIPIDNYTNNSLITLSSRRYIEDNSDSLKFEFISNQKIEKENLIAPNFTLSFRIVEGLGFWIQMAFAIVLFGISEIIFSINYSSLSSISLISLLDEITVTKLVGTTLKGIALFWIFRLVGKKIM